MKFEKAVESYLEYAKNRHKKQGFITLTSDFNSRIIPFFKDKDIYKITKSDIIDWQNYIYSLGFRYSYMSKLYIEFKVFMDYCCFFYNLDFNCVKQVGNFVKKNEIKKVDFYTLKEFNLFISGFDNIVYKTFFTFLFYTGCRSGESMALKFSDIDGYDVKITRNLTTKGGRELDSPKSLCSIRVVKIDKYLLKDLLKLKNYYEKKYSCSGYDYFVFGGIKPLAPTTIERYKKKACDKVGLRKITNHQFRHSHATLLLNNGIIINEVSRRLGHSKVSTTLDIYTHTDLSQEKRVINTLNSMRFNFFITLTNGFKNLISILKH